MSGGLVGGVVGAVIGLTFGSPQIGWMVGSSLGSLIDNKRQNSGPDMTDLRPQASEYGRPIPIVYSVMAVGGNVIWASDLVKTSDGDVGGGKGGGGGSGSGPTYAANVAILIAESDGELALGRIWAGPDKRLVYDPAGGTIESGSLRFYDGAGDQMPDPLMESYLGAGNVPAYRGFAYVVLEGFDVSAHDGNRIPFLTIEVGRKDTASEDTAPPSLGTVWFDHMVDGGANWIISYHGTYFGVLKYSKANWSLVHNRTINESWQPLDFFFYDSSRDTVVRAHHNLTSAISASGIFSTLVMSTGVYSWRVPFTVNAGETLRGVVFNQDRYVCVFKLASGGAKLVYVDPDSFAVLGTQTIDAAGSSPSWVYGADPAHTFIWAVLENGRVVRYDCDVTSTTSIDCGAAPTGFGGDTAAAFDPYTTSLWAYGVSAGQLYWAQFSNSGTRGSGDLANPFSMQFSDQPWVFVPGSPNKAYICGRRWLAVDEYAEFDADGSIFLRTVDGVYHGINYLTAAAYNDVTGKANGLRYGGLYTIGTDSTPPSLPLATGSLPGADASANSTLAYQTLAEVVTDLSVRAGLTSDDIDVTELTDQVDGYTIANQMAVGDAIKPLMQAYFFDPVEDQGKVVFVKRGGPIAVEIPNDDLGAHPSDQDGMDLYNVTRVMDEELPRTFSVNYVLAATKYSPATKYARRLVGYSGNEARQDFAMVFTDQKAQEVADVNLHTPWVERMSFTFSLPYKYAYLRPTDIVGVDGYTPRITNMTQKGAYFDCEGVRDDSDTYTPHVIVDETPPPDETVNQPSLTLIELLDINMLRDADDGPVLYVAAAAADPNATSWPGATVYVSVDGGVTYNVAFTITAGETTMGVTTDALADFQGNGTDFLGHVNVRLSHGELSSTTIAGLRSGANMAVIGDEIVFFRDATLQGDGTYDLRTFLRGRRGTSYAKSHHAAGERFVLVNLATITRVPQSTADIGSPKLYKAVTSGMTLASASPLELTFEANGLKPYPCVHLGGGRDASNNATLKWTPCARKNNEWRSGVGTVISETSESYEVEIFSSSSRTTIVRTITGLTSPTTVYSAVDQTADGLTPGATIYFRVYELSSLVGRGHAADGAA